MTPIAALAPLLLAQLCLGTPPHPAASACETFIGIAYREESELSYYDAVLVMPGDPESRELPCRVTRYGAFLHAADPPVPLSIDDVSGRRVRVCRLHRSAALVGGLPPRDAALLASVERFAGSAGHRDDVAEAWVHRGLGSDRYSLREATQAVLVRRGLRAWAAIEGGLGSRDAEVRERCRVILEVWRWGPAD